MAVIPFSIAQGTPLDGMVVITWAALVADDTGQPMAYSSSADKTVQVFGDMGGEVLIEGSNDPRVVSDPDNAVWFNLTSNLGNDLSFAAAGGALIAQAPRYVRPRAASGVTDATVIIIANKS